jgi:hypothetical protein
VPVGEDLLAELALVHGVLVVDFQVEAHALQRDEELTAGEAHELGPAGGVEGHVALLQLCKGLKEWFAKSKGTHQKKLMNFSVYGLQSKNYKEKTRTVQLQ